MSKVRKQKKLKSDVCHESEYSIVINNLTELKQNALKAQKNMIDYLSILDRESNKLENNQQQKHLEQEKKIILQSKHDIDQEISKFNLIEQNIHQICQKKKK